MSELQERVMSAVSAAEDTVSRLDERIRACAFKTGFVARTDATEAVAWSWNASSAVSLEDLVLHDENMDVRMPDEALRAAHGFLRARRKATAGGAEILSADGAAWVAGRRKRAPSPVAAGPSPSTALDPDKPIVSQLLAELDRLGAGTTERVETAVEEWLGLLAISDRRLPVLLQAAVALEGWRIVEPYPRETYVGELLVARWLCERRRVRSHLPALEAGVRSVTRKARPSPGLPPAERILFWLAVIAESSDLAGEALNRLELARQVAVTRMGARRAHSHLGALIEFLLERPVVSAPMVARRLKVSPQSARRLIAELGGSVTEISGQSRFRAWRL